MGLDGTERGGKACKLEAGVGFPFVKMVVKEMKWGECGVYQTPINVSYKQTAWGREGPPFFQGQEIWALFPIILSNVTW